MPRTQQSQKYTLFDDNFFDDSSSSGRSSSAGGTPSSSSPNSTSSTIIFGSETQNSLMEDGLLLSPELKTQQETAMSTGSAQSSSSNRAGDNDSGTETIQGRIESFATSSPIVDSSGSIVHPKMILPQHDPATTSTKLPLQEVGVPNGDGSDRSQIILFPVATEPSPTESQSAKKPTTQRRTTTPAKQQPPRRQQPKRTPPSSHQKENPISKHQNDTDDTTHRIIGSSPPPATKKRSIHKVSLSPNQQRVGMETSCPKNESTLNNDTINKNDNSKTAIIIPIDLTDDDIGDDANKNNEAPVGMAKQRKQKVRTTASSSNHKTISTKDENEKSSCADGKKVSSSNGTAHSKKNNAKATKNETKAMIENQSKKQKTSDTSSSTAVKKSNQKDDEINTETTVGPKKMDAALRNNSINAASNSTLKGGNDDSRKRNEPTTIDSDPNDHGTKKKLKKTHHASNEAVGTETTNSASSTNMLKANVQQPQQPGESGLPQETVKPINTIKKKKMTLQDKVVNLLFVSLKPYTVKILSESFQTSETTIEFLMLSLVDKGVVMKKDFVSGKGGNRTKTLYWANFDCKSKEVMNTMASLLVVPTEEQQEQCKNEMRALRQSITSINNVLAAVLDGPSNQELAMQLNKEETVLHELQSQLLEMKRRIQEHQQQSQVQSKTTNKHRNTSNKQKQNSNCPRTIKLQINRMRLEWKNRKEKCHDFIEQLADGMEKKPKDVIQLLSIETDEMCHITQLPAPYPIV